MSQGEMKSSKQSDKLSLSKAIKEARLKEDASADTAQARQNLAQSRIEALHNALKDVADNLPKDSEQFPMEFVQKPVPALWIDITSQVKIAQNSQHLQFVKDTRFGKITILETESIDEMAETVTRYLAEKILEREKFIETDWLMAACRPPHLPQSEKGKEKKMANGEHPSSHDWRLRPFFSFILGVLVGTIMLISYELWVADWLQ